MWKNVYEARLKRIEQDGILVVSDEAKYLIKFVRTNYNAIFSDLTARLSWINWENLGVHPGRRTLLTSLALGADASHLMGSHM